jgi:hypothetical protein
LNALFLSIWPNQPSQSVGACGRLQKKKSNERFLVTEQVDMNALCTVIFAFRKRMWAVSLFIVDIASARAMSERQMALYSWHER